MAAEFRKQEKDKFIEIQKKYNLSPHELVLEKMVGYDRFRYADSELVFNIYPVENDFTQFKYSYKKYTPNRKEITNMDKPYYMTDVLTNFENWIKGNVLEYIKEVNAPDPWQEFVNNYKKEEDRSSQSLHDKFNDAQIKQLEVGLDQFPIFLANRIEIPTDRYQELIDEIQDLKKELKNLSKKKWLLKLFLFLGYEVWDIVKGDKSIMNEVKEYFFNIMQNVIDHIPSILRFLTT